MISNEYRDKLTIYHKAHPLWGNTAGLWGKLLVEETDKLNTFVTKYILDYGCGKGALKRFIEDNDFGEHLKVRNYDPAVQQFSTPLAVNDNYDVVACINTLEHVEPKHLQDVIEDIRDRTSSMSFFVIETDKTGQKLPITQTEQWWKMVVRNNFGKGWELVELNKNNATICFKMIRSKKK